MKNGACSPLVECLVLGTWIFQQRSFGLGGQRRAARTTAESYKLTSVLFVRHLPQILDKSCDE